MNCHEPEMGQGSFHNPVFFVGVVEPVKKYLYFVIQALGDRRLEVNMLPAYGTRDYLQGAFSIVAPIADGDLLHSVHSAMTGREERSMPSEEPF